MGDDGIYGVGKVAEPYSMDPYTFGAYAYKHSREDGSEQWRTPVEIREGEDNFPFTPQGPGTCLGPDGLYVTGSEDASARWYVVDKASGDVAGSFGDREDSEFQRPFAVADGKLFERTAGVVRVGE